MEQQEVRNTAAFSAVDATLWRSSVRTLRWTFNAYTAFKRGDAEIVAVLQHALSIIVCATVLGELLGGFAAGKWESSKCSELTQFINKGGSLNCGHSRAIRLAYAV